MIWRKYCIIAWCFQESNKRKGCTVAEIFFVPFNRANLSEFIPMKFYMEDKETPLPFHLLDTLEVVGAHTLEQRDHFLCVYGDNWIKDVRYQLKFIPLNDSPISIECVSHELHNSIFKNEYVYFAFHNC